MKRILFLVTLLIQLSCIHAQDIILTGANKISGSSKVRLLKVVSIDVTPHNQVKTIPQTVAYTATATYNNGSTRNVTAVGAVWHTSNPAVAVLISLTTTENVQCVGNGNATISATFNNVTGNTGLTCGTPTPSGMDAYCGPGDVPSFGTNDGPAILPTSCNYTNPSALPSPGVVRTFTDYASFVAAMTAANCGDIVQGTAGITVTHATQINIPSKICDAAHYIRVRTSGFASLPAYGTKISPCFMGVASYPGRPNFNCSSLTNQMVTFVAQGVPPFGLSGNLSYMVFEGIVFTHPAAYNVAHALVAPVGPNVNHIVFEHDIFLGTPLDDTDGGLKVDRSNHVSVVDSYFGEMHCTSVIGTCTDSHTVAGGTNNTDVVADNTFKFVNNYLESSGEGTIFGGAGSLTVPTDIELRLNYLLKPQIWNPSSLSYNGGVSGHPFIVKNCIEYKNANRVFIEGNVCEGVWAGFTQGGEAIAISPKNQSNLCPICAVTNVTVRFNKVTTAMRAVGSVNIRSDAGVYATAGNSYSIHDNVADNLGYPTCYQCSPTAEDHVFSQMGIPSSLILHHVNINHNTFVYTNVTGAINPSAVLSLSGPTAASGNQSHHIVFTNNVVTTRAGTNSALSQIDITNCTHGTTSGTTMINSCWGSNTFGGNAMVQNGSVPWPGVNCLKQGGVDFTYTQLFVNYNSGVGGDYHIAVASSCHLQGTDGADPGANIDLANTATQGVNTF